MEHKEIKLDIGCGKNKKEGFIGIDIDPNSDADIIASALDLPFDNSSIDEIHCSHLVEHFYPEEAKIFFNEIYRVLKQKGVARVKIDREWTKLLLFRKDPTHKHRYTAKEIEEMVGKFSQKKVEDRIYFFRWNKPRKKIFVELVK